MTNPTVSKDAIQTILLNLVLTAAADAFHQDGTEKEDWVSERVLNQVEQFDGLIPGLKAFADLPWVDELERQGVKQLVRFCIRKAYTLAVAENKLPTKSQPSTAPAAEPTAEDKKLGEALGVPADTVLTPAQAEQAVEGEAGEEPDYEAIVAEFAKGGNWYAFPAKEKDGEEHREQGKAAAIEYLKTRDDLVYEEDAPQ